MENLYGQIRNLDSSFRKKLEVIININNQLAKEGKNLNDVGYAHVLREANRWTYFTWREKELKDKAMELVRDLEKGVTKKSQISLSPSGFQQKIEEMLTQ
ncbi:MAG: hypothetical protein V1645_03375 [archaeon]